MSIKSKITTVAMILLVIEGAMWIGSYYQARVPQSGNCYTFEGWYPKSILHVWINQTTVPQGISWVNDVAYAIQTVEPTNHQIFALVSSQSLAQVYVGFGPTDGGSELGQATMYHIGSLETGAIITLEQSANWSDHGGVLSYDVIHVLLHEFGHVAGLNHTDCSEDVMYPSSPTGLALDVLGPGDKAGLEALYP